MRILILGGTGFIGQHFASLCRATAEVTVVSRHLPSNAERLLGVTYLQGDCLSPSFLKEIIRPADHVVYLAYNSVPKTSFEDPLRDIEENLPIAINLLSVLREVRIKRLLYISSGGTVYGPVSSHTPITEDLPTNPISPYGVTKLAIEKYCLMYSLLFGIPIVIARPSNPYGPGQIPDRGQGFVATATAKILRGEELTVFGECGTVRDYLYIDDLCVALKLMLLSDVESGSVFNIGSECGMNNVEVLETIAVAAGIRPADVRINFLPPRGFDVTYNVLSSNKIKALGWNPAITLERGLEKTVLWVSNYLRTT